VLKESPSVHRHFSAYYWADRRARWRVVVLVIFLAFASGLLLIGVDPAVAIAAVGGVGAAAVAVVIALFDPQPDIPASATAPVNAATGPATAAGAPDHSS
jgi:hypothetical protein